MPRIGLKDIPFPNRLDPWAMISNLKTAWENFRKIDRYTTVSAVAGTTVLTAISQTIFANAAAGNITLTVPAAATGNVGLTYTVFKTDSTTNTVTINGTVLGGNTGASRLTLVSDGTVYRLRELYEEGTFTASLTGCTTVPTGTVNYIRNGKGITLRIPSITGTSNTAAATLTGVPSFLSAATQQQVIVKAVQNNSVDNIGFVDISGTVIGLYYYTATNSATNVFTNVGTKGMGFTTLPYTLG